MSEIAHVPLHYWRDLAWPIALGLATAVGCSVATLHMPGFVEEPQVDPEVARAVIEDVPPRLLFVTAPTLLVQFEGAPVLRLERNVVRVINTKSLVVLYDDAYWAWVGDRWFRSLAADGPFEAANQWRIPPAVDAARVLFGDEVEDAYREDRMTAVDSGAAVIGVTAPTMLVSFDGPPVFEAVPGTGLERVLNANASVLREHETGVWHVLVRERWVRGPGLDGPWTFETRP